MMFFLPLLAIGAEVSANQTLPLRDAADHRKILLGTAVSAWCLKEADYSKALGREFNQVECENEMKFASLHPRAGNDSTAYDFTAADAIVDFAHAHKMKVRGHCLVWHSQVSPWVTQTKLTPDQLHSALESHVLTVGKRYAGKVYAWDVVNEAFEWNGKLRKSVWYDAPGIGLKDQGTAYIEQSFRWARQADRHAKLYYNDYSSEAINAKSDAIYAMAKDFKARHVPLDGIGFQMHLQLGSDTPENLASIKQNFDRFAALGVDLQVTELDVALPDNKPETLERQAKVYRDVVDLCLSEKRCTGIQIWGFTDKHSWISGFSRGKMGWALILDENYAPKPAYSQILESLMQKR